MSSKFSRRLFILQMLLPIVACATEKKFSRELEFIIGTISYGEGQKTLDRFERFRKYLGDKTGAIVQFEPAFNENIAIERIKNRSWSLVFAPPGLAAIAKAKYQYVAIFPLQIDANSRSVFVVRKDSPLQQLKDLQGKTVALGVPGSATGYYLPLYNLYGLTLASLLFAPTPIAVLESVAQKQVDAGAVSLEEFRSSRTKIDGVEFRILFTDPQNVPPGGVLVSPNVELNRQQLIRNYMTEASPTLIQQIGYVPSGDIPDYKYMIAVVNRVIAINGNLRGKPVRIF
jgi:phosphonate transport system substrate-binding protein